MKTKLIQVGIVVILLTLVAASLCLAAWDNTKPADSDAVYGWPVLIRNNWDALEAAFGVDLADVSTGGTTNVHNVKNAAYGAVGDGVADDAAAIQLAIDAISTAGGGTLYFPTGVYLVGTSLDCTGFLGNVGIAYRSLHIMGDSINGSRIIGATTGTPVFDFTASGYCSMENLRISGDVTNPPNVAILLARNNVAGSAGWHNFRRVFVEGYYTKGGIYNFASEVNVFNDIKITITGGGATWCIAFAESNFAAITSPYEIILPGTAPMTRIVLLGGTLFMNDNPATGTCLYLDDSVGDLAWYGAYMYSAAQSHVKMYSSASTDVPYRISFHNLRTEGKAATTKPDYGIFMTGATNGAFGQITVKNSYIDAYIYEIYQDATVTGAFSGVIDMVRIVHGEELKFNKVTDSRINLIIGDLTVDTSITQSEVTNYHTGTVALTGPDAIIERDFGGRIFTSTVIPHRQTIVTLANNATPPVNTGNLFVTGGTTNITDFDDGVTGQIITVLCKHTLDFDTTTAQDADHNLDGSSAHLNGETGDILQWLCEDGTTWQLISYIDATDDNN